MDTTALCLTVETFLGLAVLSYLTANEFLTLVHTYEIADFGLFYSDYVCYI